MSVVTKAIGLAKKVKHRFEDEIRARTPVYLSPVRRIERVALSERICAMTFDDGPCRLPANPSADGKPLTLSLLETLEHYGAKGTFDIVGDTSANYPDTAGKEGSAQWGGIKYDHYPDFGKDADGGAKSCPELVERILSGGHEITSHTYRHVLFGPKPLVYGNRDPLPGLDAVLEDLQTLHGLMKKQYGYEIRLSRPPHYVDNTKDGLSAYDAYALMGYQYMAASYDGAGWLPLATYEAEVDAMVRAMRKLLEENPDALCGQIIFQKDGYNMARRSPVADGLGRQLELLTKLGYKVVTVSELLSMCPFRDLSLKDALFPAAKKLLDAGFCVCFRDNSVRPDAPLTRAELAMMICGCKTAQARIALVRSKKNVCKDVSYKHPYAAAVQATLESGTMQETGGKFLPDAPVSQADFAIFCKAAFGKEFTGAAPKTHADAIRMMAELI
ncbi:MAG: polysaccharide deacetylase family protein [Clostridia bacterium]|nr:polysaccharide deacetylase family protein [Clostridia bacterium]